MDEILEILEKNARLTPEEISKMVGKSPAVVKSAIKKYEKEGVILKYKALINREIVKSDAKYVRALIEVTITPQKNVGFERISERIYQFSEVKSCYLLSGGYDLLLVVEGQDIQTIANFVASKLASMENVRGTVTHFLLKKYKEDGDILKKRSRDKRLAITL